MSLKSINPKQTLAWKKLQAHFDTIKDEHMSKWFSNNPNRPAEMSVEWDDFYLDFSKNRIIGIFPRNFIKYNSKKV